MAGHKHPFPEKEDEFIPDDVLTYQNQNDAKSCFSGKLSPLIKYHFGRRKFNGSPICLKNINVASKLGIASIITPLHLQQKQKTA